MLSPVTINPATIAKPDPYDPIDPTNCPTCRSGFQPTEPPYDEAIDASY